MKAAIFQRFGEPSEVLDIQEVPAPTVGPKQVLVRMLASPINPSDLLVVRGLYGRLPTLPATPGFEGVGVIEAAGAGFLRFVRGLKPGRRVVVLNGGGGNWAEQVVVSARQVIPVPADIPDEQAASFFVNPVTAYLMTRTVLRVPVGAWLLQTAAGSALGRMVIRLGKHYGFRTLNVVRRREQAEELLRLGGDAAIATDVESSDQRVGELTQGQGVPYAIDAVGGATAVAVVRALSAGGRLLVYGTLSNEPMTLDQRLLIAGNKSIEGFWLSEWVRNQGVVSMLRLLRRVRHLIRLGVLTTEIGASFPLTDVRAAVHHADTQGRKGKVLLRMS
jgi:NADPH2:quinone reductase